MRSGSVSTIGGGQSNTASSYWATVGGGQDNIASAYYATVGGGLFDTAKAFASGGLPPFHSVKPAT